MAGCRWALNLTFKSVAQLDGPTKRLTDGPRSGDLKSSESHCVDKKKCRLKRRAMNFSSAIASCGEHAWFCKIVADGISRWVAGDTDPKSNVFALALNKDSRKLKHMRQIQTLTFLH